MVKLIKILWSDFRHTFFASLGLETLKVLVFTLLIGASTYFISVLLGVMHFASLSFFGWFIVFLILGCVVIIAIAAVIIALYVMGFIIAAFHSAFTTLPEYVEKVKERLHNEY